MLEFGGEQHAWFEYIDAPAVYLPCAPSGFVTGQHFAVDAGMTVKRQYA